MLLKLAVGFHLGGEPSNCFSWSRQKVCDKWCEWSNACNLKKGTHGAFLLSSVVVGSLDMGEAVMDLVEVSKLLFTNIINLTTTLTAIITAIKLPPGLQRRSTGGPPSSRAPAPPRSQTRSASTGGRPAPGLTVVVMVTMMMMVVVIAQWLALDCWQFMWGHIIQCETLEDCIVGVKLTTGILGRFSSSCTSDPSSPCFAIWICACNCFRICLLLCFVLAFACNLQFANFAFACNKKYLRQDVPKPKSEIGQVVAYLIVTMLTAQVLVKVGEVDQPLRGQKEDFLRSWSLRLKISLLRCVTKNNNDNFVDTISMTMTITMTMTMTKYQWQW